MRLILVIEDPRGDPDVISYALSNAIGGTPQGRPAVAGATGLVSKIGGRHVVPVKNRPR
jgi:hypothetical protein